MTEPELREKIENVLDKLVFDATDPARNCRTITLVAQGTDKILALIREAGWMDVDMVKGLIFEMQAKKCAQCKVTGSI